MSGPVHTSRRMRMRLRLDEITAWPRNLWRGRFPLAVTFWGAAIAFWATTYLVSIALGSLDDILQNTAIGVYVWTIRIIVVVGLLGAFIVWWCVGVWRSSNLSAPAEWARFLAKLAVIVVAVAFSGMYLAGLPQLISYGLDQIRDDTNYAENYVRLAPGGKEFQLQGVISRPQVSELDKLIAAHPDTKLIDLNSIGGRLNSAFALEDLIERNGLDTIVTNECSSACAIAFMGGKRRFISWSAKMGFHAPQFFVDVNRDAAVQLQRNAVKRGISPAFAQKAFPEEADELWYPSPSEMKDAHFVTDIVASK